MTKAGKSSQKFVATKPPQITSTRQGKNVKTFKTLSQQLLDEVSWTLSRQIKRESLFFFSLFLLYIFLFHYFFFIFIFFKNLID